MERFLFQLLEPELLEKTMEVNVWPNYALWRVPPPRNNTGHLSAQEQWAFSKINYCCCGQRKDVRVHPNCCLIDEAANKTSTNSSLNS